MQKAMWVLAPVCAFVIVFASLIFFGGIRPVIIPSDQQNYGRITNSPVVQPPVVIQPASHFTPEPKWTRYPAVRSVNRPDLGKTLSDIESHLPAGHIYRDADKITWGHESSHGLASQIRMQYSGGVGLIDYIDDKPYFRLDPDNAYVAGQINGFYVLNDRAVIVVEPHTTLQAVARNIPVSLRGMSYNLYMGTQLKGWNSCPLYIADEWIAYTNGSTVRAELGIKSRGESVTQMLEMGAYMMAESMKRRSAIQKFCHVEFGSHDESLQG